MNTDKVLAEKIASEYVVKNTSKIVALKKLDNLAKRGANIFAFTFGIISALVMGTGMSFLMTDLAPKTPGIMVLGVVLGVIGLAGVSVNYFIYKVLLKRGKMKYGSDILKLAKEIAEEE